MNPQSLIPATWRLFAAAGILSLPLAARAEEAPVNSRPEPRAAGTSESIQAPAGPATLEPERVDFDVPVLDSRTIAPDANHRGAVETDAGAALGAVSALTPAERTKLDLARAAVEASRTAGTLYVTEMPEDTIAATPEELASMKLQQFEARPPAPVLPDPLAGVGADLPAVQEIGPSGLSAVEEAKLRGETIPANPIHDETPAPAAANGDGASAPAKEEASHD